MLSFTVAFILSILTLFICLYSSLYLWMASLQFLSYWLTNLLTFHLYFSRTSYYPSFLPSFLHNFFLRTVLLYRILTTLSTSVKFNYRLCQSFWRYPVSLMLNGKKHWCLSVYPSNLFIYPLNCVMMQLKWSFFLYWHYISFSYRLIKLNFCSMSPSFFIPWCGNNSFSCTYFYFYFSVFSGAYL